MTFQSSSPIAVPARMSQGIGDALHAAVSSLRTFWGDHKARREMRVFDPVSDMNDYLLRDIGASDQLVSNAVARRGGHRERDVRARLAVPFLAVAIIMIAAPVPAESADPRTTTMTQAGPQGQEVGIFTGTFEQGAPVYRLPPVNVVATRKVELAKTEREERLARARQARAKAAGRDPV